MEPYVGKVFEAYAEADRARLDANESFVGDFDVRLRRARVLAGEAVDEMHRFAEALYMLGLPAGEALHARADQVLELFVDLDRAYAEGRMKAIQASISAENKFIATTVSALIEDTAAT